MSLIYRSRGTLFYDRVVRDIMINVLSFFNHRLGRSQVLSDARDDISKALGELERLSKQAKQLEAECQVMSSLSTQHDEHRPLNPTKPLLLPLILSWKTTG